MRGPNARAKIQTSGHPAPRSPRRRGGRWRARAAVTLLALLFCACTEDVGTSVRVSLVYVDTWPIETTSLTVGDEVREVTLRHELLLLLPDALDGQVMPISIAGTRGGESIANGSAVALIRKGETVDAAIVLDRVPCGVFCNPGARRCEGENAVTECVRDPEGCLLWGEPEECPDNVRICSSGLCDRSCRNECAEGEGRCDDVTHQVTCSNLDSDTCLDLSLPMECTTGQVCYSGRCAAACTYAAALGANTPIPGSNKAFGPTIAIDSLGTTHAIYSADGSRQLRYASRTKNGTWTDWQDLSGAIGENPTLIADKERNLHVVYGGASVVYGKRLAMTGAWSWRTIESGTDIGVSSSVALDADKVVHVVYYKPSVPVLRHASSSDGVTFTASDVSTGKGLRCDLAIVDKTLHVSSFDTNNELWYSRFVPGEGWTSVEVVDLTGTVVKPEASTSIAADRAGTLHIVYSDLYDGSGGDDLRYVRNSGASWTFRVVVDDTNETTGGHAELVVDPFDNLHVAYRTTRSAQKLQYAFRSAGAAGTWSIAIQPLATSGFEPSIAVGADAEVRILSADAASVVETARACTL
ncbi:MAG: hypothetical protein IPI49_11290 [Myxococcales bacterium]|nr:hypothetical protein [Myxococcales bacterium]